MGSGFAGVRPHTVKLTPPSAPPSPLLSHNHHPVTINTAVVGDGAAARAEVPVSRLGLWWGERDQRVSQTTRV